MKFWRFLAEWFVTCAAIWVTTVLVHGITVHAIPGDAALGGDPWNVLVPLAAVGLIYSVINHTIGTVVRILATPFTILTLGILALFINGFLLWLTGKFFGAVGWGLSVTDFWAAFWGAIVLGIIMWLLNITIMRSTRNRVRG